MSWNITAPSQTADTIEDAARELFDAFRSGYRDDESALVAMDEQFEAALHAAQSVLASGAVGETPVFVTLAGHANPGHRKRDGWANDQISISISQH
jgi:hypothetical protein